MTNDRNKTITIVALVVAIVAIGIGFAAFSSTLDISQTATVTPDSGSFSVVFSNINNGIDDDPVLPKTKVPTTITTTNGAIVNGTSPTLSNLSATFTDIGQKVEYELYVYNAGAYEAYLNSVTFKGTKVCTPGSGATASYVNSACNSITMTVKIGNSTYAATTQGITGHNLSVGGYEKVTVTIEYASNGVRADGPFSVIFPDVSLYYVTISGVNEEYAESPINPTNTNATMTPAQNGDTHKGIVYLDPTDLSAQCNYDNSVSTTGTKEGCMKWYIFDDSGDNYTMILDHNTTARIKWSATGRNVEYESSNLKSAVDDLVDTTGWVVNPRLITAQEINTITDNTSFSLATSDWYCLGSGVQDNPNSEPKCNSATNSSYAWLFDYTSGCTTYGCNTADSTNNGYWTSTTVGSADSGYYVWFVYKNGSFNNYTANTESAGLRPVISVSKSYFE